MLRIITFAGLLLYWGGCLQADKFYVDYRNSNGPWDGTEEHPFQTISDAASAAVEDRPTVISVAGGTYNENVVLKRESNLYGVGHPVIEGEDDGLPTILMRGQSEVKGFEIRGGYRGISVDLEAMVEAGGRNFLVNIWDCEITDTPIGIYIEQSSPLEFARANTNGRIKFQFIHNKIHDVRGSGIGVEIEGPELSTLSVSFNIIENAVYNCDRGLLLSASSTETPFRIDGVLKNNLLVHTTDEGGDGIRLVADNRASVELQVWFNTIAENRANGIAVRGDCELDLTGNILAFNGDQNYNVLIGSALPENVKSNLFWNIHITPDGREEYIASLETIDTQGELDDYYVDAGNLVADPRFTDGEFIFSFSDGVPESDFGVAGHFFLEQDEEGEYSPAVDAGGITVEEAELRNRTTRTDLAADEGVSDIGFHYRRR